MTDGASRRIAVVTGGGRGIGRATALLAAHDGYDVCIVFRSDAAAAEAVRADCLAAGARAIAVQADIGTRDSAAAVFAACDGTLGAPDLLVNNAGTVGRASAFTDLTEAVLEATFRTNVYGTVFFAQEAARRMSTTAGGRGGVIVNISSIAAVQGSPGEYVHYAASKGAVETLTVGLARELGPLGIRVNAVRAGTTLTDLHAREGNPDRPAMVARTAPLRRVARPEEIAEAALWLASDRAGFASGAILGITGGL